MYLELRERQGNWKGQESCHKYTTCLVWSPAFWKWLWHDCLVKINHTSASTQPGFCDDPSLDTLFSCLGQQLEEILGKQASPLGLYLNKQTAPPEQMPLSQRHPNHFSTFHSVFKGESYCQAEKLRQQAIRNQPHFLGWLTWTLFSMLLALLPLRIKLQCSCFTTPQLQRLGSICPGTLGAHPAQAGLQAKILISSSW